MALLRRLLTAPLAGPIVGPVRGALWIAEKVHDTAESQHNNPAALRQALAELEAQLLRGDISEAAYDSAEEDILIRLQKVRS